MRLFGEVGKAFLPRRSLHLYRFATPVYFTCIRCSLVKTSKLVAFDKDVWDEPLSNGCYGAILSTTEE